MLNLSFQLRELWICHQDILGRTDLELTKWEEQSLEKEDEAAQALMLTKNRKRKMKRLFFFPQFYCSVCKALILLTDYWFGASFLIVFFSFSMFCSFFSFGCWKWRKVCIFDRFGCHENWCKKGKNEGGTQYPHMLLPKSFFRHSKQI